MDYANVHTWNGTGILLIGHIGRSAQLYFKFKEQVK